MKTLGHISSSQLDFLHLTLERALDAIFWVDANADICHVNAAACRYLGYTREELTHLKMFDLDPSFGSENWPAMKAELKRKGVMMFESRHRTKNGRTLPVEVTSNFFEHDGKDYFFSFVRDITHHKTMEKLLHDQSEYQLELFFSQSLDGFFFMMLDDPVRWDDTVDKSKILDYVFEHQRITKVNEAMLTQYGANREEFIGLRPKDFYQHDLQYGREVWRRFFDKGRLHIETHERKLDGTPIWIEGDYICLYDDMGNITGHFGVQRDVTEHKHAVLKQAEMQVQIERYAAKLEKEVTQRTAELKRSEARLRAIINAMPDLIFVLDQDGRYQEILTTATDLLHEKAETLKGKRIQDVVPSPNADLFSAVIEQTLASGETQVIEYQLTVPAGRRWFEGRTGIVNITFDEKKCIVFVVRDITDRKRAEDLERQNIYLREEIRSEHNYGEIIGLSKPMQAVFKHIDIVSVTKSTVLLTGETGTGKELIARAIHHRSGRNERSMIKVNCGAIPNGLVESELFGHEKGAFTGATLQKKGKFELAHKGTIFLDEIGELPHDIQVKLLRVLQEQEFERVGGVKTIKVDVRVIAATNRDLQEAVQRSAFRSDLFFRLNIFPIQVPPLRERTDDILPLANFFISKFARRLGKHIKGIHQMALNKLDQYNWPGNVRELANILERAVILCQGSMLQKEHICGLMVTKPMEGEGMATLAEVERRHIMQVLEKTEGVLSGSNGAAAILGMKRSTLWSRMQKLGISVSKEIYKNQP